MISTLLVALATLFTVLGAPATFRLSQRTAALVRRVRQSGGSVLIAAIATGSATLTIVCLSGYAFYGVATVGSGWASLIGLAVGAIVWLSFIPTIGSRDQGFDRYANCY